MAILSKIKLIVPSSDDISEMVRVEEKRQDRRTVIEIEIEAMLLVAFFRSDSEAWALFQDRVNKQEDTDGGLL